MSNSYLFIKMYKPVYFVYKVQKQFATLGICLEKYEILNSITVVVTLK